MGYFWLSSGLGLFLLFIEILIISKKNKCTTVIQGQFIRNNEIIVGSTTSYCPIFRYYFNGMMYEKQTFDTVSKKIAKSYVWGYIYPIYINPNKPTNIVVDKKINFLDYLLLAMGGCFLLFAIIYILTK